MALQLVLSAIATVFVSLPSHIDSGRWRKSAGGSE